MSISLNKCSTINTFTKTRKQAYCAPKKFNHKILELVIVAPGGNHTMPFRITISYRIVWRSSFLTVAVKNQVEIPKACICQRLNSNFFWLLLKHMYITNNLKPRWDNFDPYLEVRAKIRLFRTKIDRHKNINRICGLVKYI